MWSKYELSVEGTDLFHANPQYRHVIDYMISMVDKQIF